MQAAGLRRHRIRFERRTDTADSYGNTVADWTAVATVWAGVETRQKGRVEAVEAGRLESHIGWRLTVPRSALLAGLSAGWRAVITAGPHTGATLNIRTVESAPDGREWVLDVESGVAT